MMISPIGRKKTRADLEQNRNAAPPRGESAATRRKNKARRRKPRERVSMID